MTYSTNINCEITTSIISDDFITKTELLTSHLLTIQRQSVLSNLHIGLVSDLYCHKSWQVRQLVCKMGDSAIWKEEERGGGRTC